MGSVVPNRGGIHDQGLGVGSLPGTGQAWRSARWEQGEGADAGPGVLLVPVGGGL